MEAISHCFFCLESIPPNSKLNGGRINLKCLYKLLKINSEGYQAKSLCQECLETLEKFNELYMCLEVIQMELYDCLKLVQKNLVKNKCSSSQHLFGNLRNIIVSKCNKEISKSKPTVKVKKWDFSQSHSLTVKDEVAPSNLNYYVEESVDLNHDLTGDTEPAENPAIATDHCQTDPGNPLISKPVLMKHNEVENHRQLQANYNEGNKSCILCGKEFRNFYRFKRHFESIHMQFSCDLCKNYSSNWEWELDKHMRMCHSELNQQQNSVSYKTNEEDLQPRGFKAAIEDEKDFNLTTKLMNFVPVPLSHEGDVEGRKILWPEERHIRTKHMRHKNGRKRKLNLPPRKGPVKSEYEPVMQIKSQLEKDKPLQTASVEALVA